MREAGDDAGRTALRFLTMWGAEGNVSARSDVAGLWKQQIHAVAEYIVHQQSERLTPLQPRSILYEEINLVQPWILGLGSKIGHLHNRLSQ